MASDLSRPGEPTGFSHASPRRGTQSATLRRAGPSLGLPGQPPSGTRGGKLHADQGSMFKAD